VRLVRVTSPHPGSGSGAEVVLVLVPPPGLGTHPCGRVRARRYPGRRPGDRGRPPRHRRRGSAGWLSPSGSGVDLGAAPARCPGGRVHIIR